MLPCIFITMHIHYYAYSLPCIFMFLCIFITMHIHYNAYSFLCIFITMHIHFYAYSFLCIFITMHIHFYTYSSLCIFIPWHRSVYISYCPSHSKDRQRYTDRERTGQTRIDIHIRLQKILHDRIPIVRNYRLSGWFYNKLYDCRIVCRCYNSYRQAVLYESILWQVQVVL